MKLILFMWRASREFITMSIEGGFNEGHSNWTFFKNWCRFMRITYKERMLHPQYNQTAPEAAGQLMDWEA